MSSLYIPFCFNCDIHKEGSLNERVSLLKMLTFYNGSIFGTAEEDFFILWNDGTGDRQAVTFQLTLNIGTFIL